jgi:hypothetical protein
MIALLGKGEALESNDSLPDDLDRFLEKGMHVVDDCLVIGELMPRLHQERQRMDRTGFECFVNHVHLREIKSPVHVLRQAIAFCRRAALEARRIAPDRSIRFIVSRNDDRDWTVHLHTSRFDEPSWVSDDLEAYLGEAVLILDSPELLPAAS